MSEAKRRDHRSAFDEARVQFELQKLDRAGERFLSPADIAKMMRVTKEAVQQWIYRGKLPATKLNGEQWKVRVADFEALLRAREAVGSKSVLITGGPRQDCPELLEVAGELGLLPVHAHNYADALLKALDCQPALIVIHILDGDPDCWKFAARVRSHKPLKMVPILLIGGTRISEADGAQAALVRAKGILARPLNKTIVKNEIARILLRNQ